MALEYLLEYRTYLHLGSSYGVSESTCYNVCRWVEDSLIKDKAFSLPGKKVLLQSDTLIEAILIDATESPIERPKKKSSTEETNQESEQQTTAVLLGQEKAAHYKKSSGSGQELSKSHLHTFLQRQKARF